MNVPWEFHQQLEDSIAEMFERHLGLKPLRPKVEMGTYFTHYVDFDGNTARFPQRRGDPNEAFILGVTSTLRVLDIERRTVGTRLGRQAPNPFFLSLSTEQSIPGLTPRGFLNIRAIFIRYRNDEVYAPYSAIALEYHD